MGSNTFKPDKSILRLPTTMPLLPSAGTLSFKFAVSFSLHLSPSPLPRTFTSQRPHHPSTRPSQRTLPTATIVPQSKSRGSPLSCPRGTRISFPLAECRVVCPLNRCNQINANTQPTQISFLRTLSYIYDSTTSLPASPPLILRYLRQSSELES